MEGAGTTAAKSTWLSMLRANQSLACSGQNENLVQLISLDQSVMHLAHEKKIPCANALLRLETEKAWVLRWCLNKAT